MASPIGVTGAGAALGLQDLVAKAQEQRWKQAEFEARAGRDQENVRHSQAQEAFQRDQLAQTGQYQQDQLASLDAMRKEQAANLVADNERLAKTQTLGRLNMRAMGSAIPITEQNQELAAGAPAGYYGTTRSFGAPLGSTGEDAQGPVIPTVESLGTEAQQVARLKERNDQAKDVASNAHQVAQEEHAIKMEQIAATNAQNAGTRERRVRNMNGVIGGTDSKYPGEKVNQVIDVNDGSIVREERVAPPPGQAEKNATDAADLEMIGQLEKLGEETQWEGTGYFTGALSGQASKMFGAGTDETRALRTALASLKTSIGHEKFGSAFTKTEREALAQFAPDPDTHPNQIKSALRVLRYAIQTRINERQAGRPDTAITTLLGGPPKSDGQSTVTPAPAKPPAAATPPGTTPATPGYGRFQRVR